MNGIGVVKTALNSTRDLLNWYLGDLSDQDLLHHPAPGANNIAWQMGHLIDGEIHLLQDQSPGAVYPELPPTMKNQYTAQTAVSGPPGGYLPKSNYLEWFGKVRAATLDNLAKLTDADLDKKTTGSMAKFAPTLGDLYILVANHTLMHAGQFTVVRRALQKPVLF